ncbi:MAG: TIGR00730 family Rossman fold protein [Chloroflexi bacterium]|nr:TIGR00730 family Rossman fold protein [Chloroflexota bacterium]
MMGNMTLDTPEDILKEVQAISTFEGRDLRAWLYREILLNALKCKQDELDILDIKLINRALVEFRHAARVFKPYRKIRKVSIFGSARVAEGEPHYEMAVRFGRLLAGQGFMVITGAGEGIMRAAIEGASAQASFGVSILLPMERRPAAAIQDDPKLVTFRYFFTRKVFFVMEADAFALFPGGFGTHDESFEVLTLLQTGKAPPMPLVLMELPGDNYWETWDGFIKRQLLARGYVSPEDLSFYKIVHSPEEGADWVKSYYSTYHSMRQVHDALVIRLEKELLDDHVGQLSESFRDLLRAGDIHKTAPLPQEEDEADLLLKPRIAFTYNKQSAGRLNEMVLAINEMGRAL